MPRRLVCVVEGHGEVEAIPQLCAGVLYRHLGVTNRDWGIDPNPVRQPRNRLVDQRGPEGRRPPHGDGITKALALVRGRSAGAALVLVDSDKDCPGAWGPPARDLVRAQIAGIAVMAVREYEAWLIAGHAAVELEGDDADAVRNPKGKAKDVWAGYKPTTHQLKLTREMDIGLAVRRSRSFAYLVEALRQLTAPR
jgi:hypothetical protein